MALNVKVDIYKGIRVCSMRWIIHPAGGAFIWIGIRSEFSRFKSCQNYRVASGRVLNIGCQNNYVLTYDQNQLFALMRLGPT